MTISAKKIEIINSDRYRQERERIEQELNNLASIHPDTAKILTAEGFLGYFIAMRELYPSYIEAYERLEEFYTRITGRRRYSEYAVMCRALNNLRNRK